jgi:predicted negative regulator of RcsB-dependent stress response
VATVFVLGAKSPISSLRFWGLTGRLHPLYMESDVTQSALFYKLWAWGDKNRKQLLYGVVALVVLLIAIAFWLAHQNETQNDANDALSKLTSRQTSSSTPAASPDSLLKVASDYAGTEAAQRALLLAATDLFAAGKYDEAQTQFQKFLQQYAGSPLAAQAALGMAASYDAQNKTNDAVTAYQGVVDRYQTQNVAPQARLALARLQAAQGKVKEARNNLEELSRSNPGTITSQAGLMLQELNAAHPELEPTNKPVTVTAPAIKLETPAK